MDGTATGPLAGLKIIECAQVVAGPTCGYMLADLGAEVIKIERRETGDDTRQWGPPWLKDSDGNNTKEAAYYLSANRGKHSVTLDIATGEGCQIVRDLAAASDVFIENFKVGDLAGKGLGYDDLASINPGIIYCSITGFGQTGPRASQALMLATRARALLQGRYSPSIDDILALAKPVLRHRMALTFAASADGITIDEVIDRLCAPLA